jgi:hypothetical protein
VYLFSNIEDNILLWVHLLQDIVFNISLWVLTELVRDFISPSIYRNAADFGIKSSTGKLGFEIFRLRLCGRKLWQRKNERRICQAAFSLANLCVLQRSSPDFEGKTKWL